MFLPLVVLLALAGNGFSARILAVVPFPGRSHQLFIDSILKTLAQRGHQIFQYSPFPPKFPVPNLTHVEIHNKFEAVLNDLNFEDMVKITEKDQTMFASRAVWNINYMTCEDTFTDKNVKKLLDSEEKFDLVLTESSFGQESLLVFGHRFGAPIISVESYFTWSAVNRDAGNSLSISYIPELIPMVTTEKMTFYERVLNFLAITSNLFLYYNSHIPRQDEILKRHIPNAPSVAELISNVSLYFTNSHPTAINYVRPYSPNIVPIGGIQITPKRQQLPQDMQSFLDTAPDGVIYFSLGTVVPSHTMPKQLLQSFINVFKRLPQRVLWKIDFNQLPPTSDNVKIVKWVPQPGVLAHPNCALFITHGGLFSQHEAIYAGVPTVGIPFFSDQPYNIMYNEYRGIGVKLDLYSINEENVYAALNTVLSNPEYKQNAERMSRIYRDQPMSPAESAVYWTEYVLRHRGAPHLRPTSALLPWYQLALLDVLATVLAVIALLLTLLFIVAKKVISLFVMSNKYKPIHDKKNK